MVEGSHTSPGDVHPNHATPPQTEHAELVVGIDSIPDANRRLILPDLGDSGREQEMHKYHNTVEGDTSDSAEQSSLSLEGDKILKMKPSKPKTYTCFEPGCGSVFTRKSKPALHLRARHRIGVRIDCPEVSCERGPFSQLDNFYEHVKKVHRKGSD